MKKKRKFSEGLLDEEIIFKNLNIKPGQIILDAGCGNGYMAKKFSKLSGRTGKTYAIDPDESLISTLSKEIEETNIEAFVGDITKRTIITDSSVDLVYLSTVFHIFSDIEVLGFQKEINRILKPKAKLAIVNINKEITSFGPPKEMKSSPEELREKLSFNPVKLITLGDYFYMQLFEKI
ncbi:MAG: class I SAM-dependent methyltransferase [Desulfobacterales bacterium]